LSNQNLIVELIGGGAVRQAVVMAARIGKVNERVRVEIDDRQITLSNLAKVLYPSGFTKGQVIDYYSRIAPTMVPHLANRCLTLKRFPDGTEAQGFFEKRCPKHRPGWLPVSPGPRDRRGGIDYCRIEEPAALVWAANMAALELHAPMAHADDQNTPRALVFDLDPGPGTDIGDCCAVALRVREILVSVGVESWCKTSGSKGLQLYAPLNTPAATHDHTAAFARAVGSLLEKQTTDKVTTTMAKSERPGKIFVDWSQNAFHKTTIAVYSLRARREPTVSAPVTWDEVEQCAEGELALRFESADVLARVVRHGDLFAPVLATEQSLPRHPA
jgi:bifunctional non-homologous end joining protein LigD